MIELRQLIRALVQFVSTWWGVDRIRIARSEGRLLRIQPGQQLLIGHQTFVVLGSHGHQENGIAHFCISLEELETDPTELWYLEHDVPCSKLMTHDDEPWRFRHPNGDCKEIDSDSVICYSPNSN
jgi:hypothetical protein